MWATGGAGKMLPKEVTTKPGQGWRVSQTEARAKRRGWAVRLGAEAWGGSGLWQRGRVMGDFFGRQAGTRSGGPC